jgi:hypothetical protein
MTTTLNTMAFCTLRQVKDVLNLMDTPEDSAFDADLLDLIQEASYFVRTYCGRSFVPYKETRVFPYSGRAIYSPKWLCPDNEMLDVITIINGDNMSVSLADVLLEPLSASAKHTICIRDDVDLVWLPNNIQVMAVWGYHPYYSGAWVKVGTLLSEMSSGDTAISFLTPVIGGGEFLRIDDEVMFVSSAASGSGPYSYSLSRGMNGYTRADHIISTDVYRYVVLGDVSLAVSRLVAWLFKSANTIENRVQLTEGRNSMVVQQSPSEIWLMLDNHVKRMAK